MQRLAWKSTPLFSSIVWTINTASPICLAVFDDAIHIGCIGQPLTYGAQVPCCLAAGRLDQATAPPPLRALGRAGSTAQHAGRQRPGARALARVGLPVWDQVTGGVEKRANVGKYIPSWNTILFRVLDVVF